MKFTERHIVIKHKGGVLLVGRDSVSFNKSGNYDLISFSQEMMIAVAKIKPWAILKSADHTSIIRREPLRHLKQSGRSRIIGSNSLSQEYEEITYLLKPERAASNLGVSIKTLHRLCREGRIGFVRINDKQRGFRADQIQDYIERGTVQPRIDSSLSSKVHSLRKGGEKKKSIMDSRADLRKEMSQWQ
jgi:excisionase family DNA binding protein